MITWRMVFFINLPVTAFAMIVDPARGAREPQRGSHARHRLPRHRSAVRRVGGGSGSAGPGDPEGVHQSGRARVAARRRASLLIAFFLTEPRQRDRALVPTQVLHNQVFAASCTAVLLMSAIFFAALLYLPQFMENVLEILGDAVRRRPTATDGGLRRDILRRRRLYGRLGPRATVSGGAALLTAGMAILSFLNAGSTYLSLVPGMIVLGMGVGLFYSSVTTAAITALDPSRSSLAGGIVYMCQIAGGAIGLGLNTAIVLAAGTLSEGIAIAFRIDAALAAAGLLVSLTFIRGPESPTAHRTGPGQHLARPPEPRQPRLQE